MLWCDTRWLSMEQVWHEERGEKCVSSNVVSFLPGELKLWWLRLVVCMCAHFLFEWNFFFFTYRLPWDMHAPWWPRVPGYHWGYFEIPPIPACLQTIVCRVIFFSAILESLPDPICRSHYSMDTFIAGWPLNINLTGGPQRLQNHFSANAIGLLLTSHQVQTWTFFRGYTIHGTIRC